ncbi:MAG: RHS repeat-associated core domain-containing protein, partial [bacterium]
YLNSRYYDANIGRFINADGLLGSFGDSQTTNMYAYCANNPVMNIDPFGMSWWSELNPGYKVLIGVGVILALGVLTVISAGGLTGAMAAFYAVGSASGTVTLTSVLATATVNAIVGGFITGVAAATGTSVIGFASNNFSWNDVGSSFANGFAFGTVTGAFSGVISGISYSTNAAINAGIKMGSNALLYGGSYIGQSYLLDSQISGVGLAMSILGGLTAGNPSLNIYSDISYYGYLSTQGAILYDGISTLVRNH